MKMVYFILGMHRSGTSALGGTLNLMGLEFGSNLMIANDGNPKGYFENNFICKLNEKILLEAKSVWHDIHFKVDNINKNKFDEYATNTKEIMISEFKYAENFGLK